MKTTSSIKNIISAVGLIFVLGFGCYLFLAAMVTKLNSVQSDLVKTLVTAAATVFIAAITLVIGKLWEQRQTLRQDLRTKKVPIYEQQLQTIFKVIFAEKLGEEAPTDKEFTKAFSDFTQQLVIWGSSDVIKAWGEFRTNPYSPDNPIEGMLRLEAVLRAMRKDLGNDINNLSHGDLLRLVLNDGPNLQPSAM